jgi:glycosyltransferase involved in cell wall biosynthesis
MTHFSVLLSVYYKERPEFLRLALDSLFAQTARPTEVVLVEDGKLTSELDNVVNEYEKVYPELKVFKYEKNRGLGFALNDGLKHCSHDIIARADTDDICKPERFEKQLKVLEEHPEYDLVSSWIDEFVDDPAHVTSIRKLPELPEDNLRYAKKRCPVNHPAVMYRKKAVLEADGYLTDYFPEDYFLWIRMLMNGCEFYNIQESLVFFRFSPETFKRRGGWKYACDEVRIQKRIFQMGFITLPQFIQNVIIRFSTRIMPNRLRGWIYMKFLRKKS